MNTPEKFTEEALINQIIETGVKGNGVNANLISDGYHTFGELYEHRITLFIALCGWLPNDKEVWKSKFHSDGSSMEGWFVMGIGKEVGQQITYHLPISKWDECDVQELDKAPEWDGHTSSDVLERLKSL
jgi:hypothetical protein